MSTQGLKSNFWTKATVFILAVGFVLGSGAGRIYANSLTSSDKLRIRQLKQDGQVPDVIHSLTDKASRQDGGSLVGEKGVINRLDQIRFMRAEIDKELAQPGTGNLPRIAVISDYHGDAARFAELLSGALNKLAGFTGKLDPSVSIEQQLNAQGLSLKTMKGAIYFNGDLLDRGKDGIKCFLIVKELIETAPDKVLYNSGNHDLWAFLNLMGFHLPWYEGYNFYANSGVDDAVTKEAQAAAMAVKLHSITEPRFFNSASALLAWTKKLAEFNAFQTKLQKEFFVVEENGEKVNKAEAVRGEYVGYYKKYSQNWNKEQIHTWEFFAGHFASLDVPDPEVGLNGIGKTSAGWWQDIHKQLIKGREARSNTGADADELKAWDEAIAQSAVIAKAVQARLDNAVNKGDWMYLVLESINSKAYESVEWWGKDWSSHKGWGEEVIKEINAMAKQGLLKEETQELTQENYITSPTLKSLADFYRKNFNLYLKDPYGNVVTHGWLPVAADGSITITYKGKEYTGNEVFDGLEAISNDVKDTNKPLKEVWEGLNIVNSWYADATTTLKPKNVKSYREKIGIAKIQSKLGVRNWLTGHNPLNKLKTSFMNVQDGYTHFEVDKGMADKFGHEGLFALISANGIKAYGFEAKASQEVIDDPKTVIAGKEGAAPTVFDNKGLAGKELLTMAKNDLENEYNGLLLAAKAQLNFADVKSVNDALIGIISVNANGVKIENAGLLRDVLIDKLVYDATFNKNAEVVALCRKLIKETAAAQGAVLGSVYDLYVQKAKDPKNYSVPAINIRGNTYNTAQAVFESAIDNKVGIFIAEIAKSEIGYTGQRPAEYTTTVLAAAIKTGWKQPVYVQGDHFQIDLKKYKVNSDEARDEIKKLIKEAMVAGFYQIDLDMSVLVDFNKGSFLEQQKENGTETAILTAYVRALERELGLDKLGVVINLGGEIGEIGKGVEKDKQRNSSIDDLKAFWEVYNSKLAELSKEAGYELKPITKIAIQTGSKHGGIRNAEGQLVKAKISFNTIAELGKYARENLGLAGVVQHGASTLDPRCFVVFAGHSAPQGFEIGEDLLNSEGAKILVTNPAGEVHLATQYQDVIIDHPALPAVLRDKIREFIFNKIGVKEGEEGAEGKYTENRKNAWGPFKQQLWNMPSDIQGAIRQSLRQQFDIVFNNMGVKNSQIFLAEALANPRLNFADVKSVNDALIGIISVNANGVKIENAGLLRDVLIDKLVYDATFNKNAEVVALCRKLIKETAAAQGAVLGSVYDLYVQKAKDPKNYSVPAINIRGNTYNTAQAVFESAIDNKVGIFIAEIAKSEIGYTGQRPAEYTTTVLAAAIKTGWKQPVYVQGDHFQIDLKKYKVNSDEARDEIKKLIKEAMVAGFYQIDLDMSVLVDFNKGSFLEQQKENGTETAILTAYVRALERELGLDKLGVVINLGGEIGEIGKGVEKDKQRNSSIDDLKAFWEVYNSKLAELSKEAGYELKPITKIAIQTGSKHGGIRNAEGQLVKAKISFNTIAELGKYARENLGLAGVVQHGASTLDPRCFVVFAGREAPQGFEIGEDLLNSEGAKILVTNPAGEVHLATQYQDVIIDHPALPAVLREKIREFIFNKIGVKAGEEGAEGKYTENRKNAWGPFKQQLWNMPSDIQGAIRQSLRRQFDIVFNNMGVRDSFKHVANVFANSEIQKKWGKDLADITGSFSADVTGAVSESAKAKNELKDGKVYPILFSYDDVMTSPDGLLALINKAGQLGGGNIKLVPHLNRAGLSVEEARAKVTADLQKINQHNKGNTPIDINMFAAVVAGTDSADVARQVKAAVGADIFEVVGPAEYVKEFNKVKKIVLDKAGESQVTSVAKAIKVAVEMVPGEGKASAEDVKKMDELCSLDKEGSFHIQAANVKYAEAERVSNYQNEIAAAIGV